MAINITTEPWPTLTLDLTPEEASRVAAAQRQGVDLSALLKGVIARLPNGVPGADSAGAAPAGTEVLHPGMTFSELLAPLREDFAATNMTDEEMGAFVDETVRRVRAQRREREADAHEGDAAAAGKEPLIILGREDG